MQSTAEAMVPCPVSTSTGRSGNEACSRRTSSRPSTPGILRSVSTRSTGARPRWFCASAAPVARITSKPREPSSSPSDVRTYASSSTTNTVPRAGFDSAIPALLRLEYHLKYSSPSGAPLGLELRAMLAGDGVADGESQPRGILRRVERLEHPRRLRIGHAGAPIRDLGDDSVLLPPGHDPDLAAFRLRLAGVEHQVQKDLSQHCLVSLDDQRFGRQLE